VYECFSYILAKNLNTIVSRPVYPRWYLRKRFWTTPRKVFYATAPTATADSQSAPSDMVGKLFVNVAGNNGLVVKGKAYSTSGSLFDDIFNVRWNRSRDFRVIIRAFATVPIASSIRFLNVLNLTFRSRSPRCPPSINYWGITSAETFPQRCSPFGSSHSEIITQQCHVSHESLRLYLANIRFVARALFIQSLLNIYAVYVYGCQMFILRFFIRDQIPYAGVFLCPNLWAVCLL